MIPLTASVDVRTITAAMRLPLRQSVLWPQATLVEMQLADDAHGLHIGGFVADTLCCLASFFITAPGEARLRKFATDPAWQGQGLGSAVLHEGARQPAARGIGNLWFDARASAQDFYRHRGFRVEGAPFHKGTVPYVRMRGALAHVLSG